MTVLLRIRALDNDDQVILRLKLRFEAQKVLVIFLVRAHEVTATRGELQIKSGIPNAENKEKNLRVKKPTGLRVNGLG